MDKTLTDLRGDLNNLAGGLAVVEDMKRSPGRGDARLQPGELAAETPGREPASRAWCNSLTQATRRCQMALPDRCQMGHPPALPEVPDGLPTRVTRRSPASHAAKEGAEGRRGQTQARGRARPWLGRTRRRQLAASPGWCGRSGEAAQAAARTQRGSVVVGARWRYEATRASHVVGSRRRPGGARPRMVGASCRLPAAHST